MLDPLGLVTSWNPGAQRIKGYLPRNVIGRHVSAFYTKEDIANGEPEQALATAVEPGRFKKEGWLAGFGLSMVRGFAEQLGGRLVLESRKDKGTFAELSFPAASKSICHR